MPSSRKTSQPRRRNPLRRPPINPLLSLLLPAALLFTLWLASAAAEDQPYAPANLPQASGKVDFKTDIAPIFASRCVECHGLKDGKLKQEGGLRLDDRVKAMEGGDHGLAIVPGKPLQSLLIQKVHPVKADDEGRMPGRGAPLSAQQIGQLVAWISQGADWPDDAASPAGAVRLWSLEPIKSPPAPGVDQTGAAWGVNPIDRFVYAALSAHSMKPAPLADRATLLRRLSFDLRGLSPMPEEMQAWEADESPDAYERLVDRMLASPQFGERWARHWLDLARYADSDGYEKDTIRPDAFRYRDWVIGAFNGDMPYDRFTIEQLAGDLLPGATDDQKIATGLHRMTLTNKEGGVNQEEYRVKAVKDRVSTTSIIWLGLTVGCAECHSHKYDPITQTEYYKLYAFFNNADESNAPFFRPASQADALAIRQHEEKVVRLQERIRQTQGAAEGAWETWANGLDPQSIREPTWTPAKYTSIKTTGEVKLEKQSDGSLLATGPSPAKAEYTLAIETPAAGAIGGLKLEAIPDGSLGKNKGPGRATNGNFVLSEIRVYALNPDSKPRRIQPAGIRADFSQNKYPAEHAIDGDAKTGWAINPQFGKAHQLTLWFTEPIKAAGIQVVLDQQHGQGYTVGRFKLSTADAAADAFRMTNAHRTAIPLLPDKRTDEQRKLLADYYAAHHSPAAALVRELEMLKQQAPALPRYNAMIMQERPKPRQTYLHVRGNYKRNGPRELTPGLPSILPAFKPSGPLANRLDLARWLTNPDHPLPARVAVNRIWGKLLGHELVRTPDDFGSQGARPTHPELLDWLASQYLQSGWSNKHLIRLIVTSSTYRQSSQVTAQMLAADPDNEWIGRQNRQRLEGEIIWDHFLRASGLLHLRVGGPSSRPYLEPGIAELTYANSFKWQQGAEPDIFRRGMYIHFQRTSPYPSLMTFDCPESNELLIKRTRSNTPLMALTTLNNSVYLQGAQAMAQRLFFQEPTDEAARLRLAGRLALGRDLPDAYMDRLRKLLADQRSLYAADPAAAKLMIGKFATPGVADAQGAAWVALCRALLNLDAALTRE